MPRKRKHPQPDQTACVIYARFSSDRQRDESIEDQVAVCSQWAASNGLAVVMVYADRAISGTSDERPEFRRMVSDSASGAFGTVVVYKLDRFARDRFDGAFYRKTLRDRGVALQSAMESIPEGPEGAILESVIEGYNEYYSRNLAQNVLRGMTGNARKCLTNGNKVYGYRTGADGRYEVDPEEAEIVRGAFELASMGMSRVKVLEWMDGKGARTKRGGRFTLDSLRTLLTNERYTGVYIWGDVRVEGGMPRLVSRERFEAVAKPRKRPRRNAYPLSGKLFDYDTGTPFRGTYGTSANGTHYMYYSAPLDGRCERRYPKDAVEKGVTGALQSAFRDEGIAEEIARAAIATMEAAAEGEAVRAAERRIREIDVAQGNLLRAIEMGVMPDGMAERLSELREERGRLERKLAAGKGAIPTVAEMARWVRDKLIGRKADVLLERVVQRCTIDAEGTVRVEIPWSANTETVKSCNIFGKENGEPAAQSGSTEVLFGSPYQIRTGDLRLERAAS